MGTSLTGVKIKDSYDSLLKVTDNGPLDGSLQVITDGLGNNSALSLSTAGASVGGTLAVSGAATLSSTLAVTGATTLSSTLSGTQGAFSLGTVGGSIGSVKNLTVANTTGGIGDFVGLNFAFYNSTTNFGYIGSVITSAASQSASDLVFGTKSSNSATAVTEYMRIKSGGDISFRDSSANEAFYWDASAASLGIGTTSPELPLDVRGVIQSKGTDSLIRMGQLSATATYIQSISADTTTSRDLIFFGTSERMRIDSSGNVGIGTSPSGAKFHIVASNTTAKFESSTTGLFNTYKNSNGDFAYVGTGSQTVSGGSANDFGVQAVNNFVIATGGNTERMRITSGGTVCIGATAQVQGEVLLVKTSGGGTSIATQSTDDFYIPMRFIEADGDLAGYISAGTGFVAYNTSSDYRLKENVVELTDALDRIDNIKPCRFNFIKNPSRTVDGFLAHELQEVVPEAVHGEKDAVELKQVEVSPAVLDEEGNVITEAVYEEQEVPVYQGIDQSKIVPLLVAAIQELKAKVESLEVQLNA